MTRGGGRGRGRGAGVGRSSGDYSVIGKDDLQPIVQPLPTFPNLSHKAVPLQLSREMSYLWELKRDFADSMQDSIYNVQLDMVNKDIERYSDMYAKMMQPDVKNWDEYYDWTMMPKNLKRKVGKRKLNSTDKSKETKDIDVEKKLMKLEQKEKANPGDVGQEIDEDDDDDETKKVEDDLEEVPPDSDEEMDEGTDYGNNYFDNGENYEEEDDNFDGPIL